ncbi:type I secretion outer membrane protein, TolC family [Beggiatoa alba B18LD]|uniref:Type I secretion outer membrane protein, TolC family n=1 Tax=Beggiatoa alba B18LD TaxID=395493 RepID=I3CH79_9GAMM|nr:TolC family outer membrane protein [Beggiatoa alba]EIJ42972.1 type I secretion outer membrane protein, TolC family [Beggiatoa alba B18LD]
MNKTQVVLLSIGCFFSQIVLADSLPDVIKRTLESNPDVLISTNTRLAVDQTLAQARANYFPSVELLGGYGKENSDNPTTQIQTGDDRTLTRRELSLMVSQRLFDGFNTQYAVATQRAKVESAAYQVAESAELIGLRTSEVYLEVFRRKALLELAKDNLVTHQKTLEQVREVVESGARGRADLQQTESRLALASSNLVNAQGNLRDAEANYQRVTGEMPKQLETVNVELVRQAIPSSLEALLDAATQNHPALQSAQAEITAAESAYQQSGANYMPQVYLELGASKNKNLDGVEGNNDDLSAMLKMRYNLYNGGADSAKRAETAKRLDIAKETLRKNQRIVEENARLAWNGMITMQERLQHLQQHVTATESVLSSYREQFKLGQRSLLDVLDSENELFSARSALVAGQYAELLSFFNVLESEGQLLHTLNIPRPTEASIRKD